MTNRRVIKEGHRVIKRDWVDHLTCRLSHYVKLRRKQKQKVIFSLPLFSDRANYEKKDLLL